MPRWLRGLGQHIAPARPPVPIPVWSILFCFFFKNVYNTTTDVLRHCRLFSFSHSTRYFTILRLIQCRKPVPCTQCVQGYPAPSLVLMSISAESASCCCCVYRVRRFYEPFRPPTELCRYTTLRHKRDGSNPANRLRFG